MRHIIGLIVALTLAIPAQAETYPTRAINIVVALAAGTGMDTVVRLYSEKLSQSFGKPVVVENKPGSAGLVAVEALLQAPADGHTLGATTSSIMAIRPSLFKTPPYDPLRDFIPISVYLKSPFILVVDPALPARSVPELVAYIRAHPGKISFSSSSVGSAPHLAAEYMKQRFDLDINHVPYRSSPQSIADVAAGHISMSFAEAGVSLPLIHDGKLRALAVTSLTRLPSLPDVPSFAEASGVADFEMVSWHVLLAKAGTPDAIIERLRDELARIMADPKMQDAMTTLGLIPQPPQSLAATRAYVASENEKWGALVKRLGMAGSI
ncbi:tripartite tricarboxylate transporter substrate binding protein [Bradyrhizobium jicamae]|uniref:Bug family tripartite tricarboxylate transporter substrate binding protein n=1 Tax=Bradyrhizobium jicamae TaxID=280332 RepID=UPI001BA72685|nr:tripartite tricarboxylate transporter substrate binding protein [Bradyrhizobium jicamae]MBR0751853.1 tripartite tricarboxylate transporter substrate binding protein [Bradyrhizobium jicamae]